MPEVPLSEQWRPVIGWELLYEVSDRGRVRTCRRQMPCIDPAGRYAVRTLPCVLLKQAINKRGHRRVMLKIVGRKKCHAYVHILVAAAFIGPRPDGLLVCHRNDDKRDNHEPNLYYGTKLQNARDAMLNRKIRRMVG